MDVDVVVPGHGDAERDHAYLRRNIALMEHVIADVKTAKAGGQTLDQIKKAFADRGDALCRSA